MSNTYQNRNNTNNETESFFETYLSEDDTINVKLLIDSADLRKNEIINATYTALKSEDNIVAFCVENECNVIDDSLDICIYNNSTKDSYYWIFEKDYEAISFK